MINTLNILGCSIPFYITIIIIGILMSSECINISYYSDNCCKIVGNLSTKTVAFSTQGLTNINTCFDNTIIPIRYPPSKYWKLYINSINQINHWYSKRINTTFYCKIYENNAVTGDCDFILPLSGTILSLCCMLLTMYIFINMLNNNTQTNTQRRYISSFTNPIYVVTNV